MTCFLSRQWGPLYSKDGVAHTTNIDKVDKHNDITKEQAALIKGYTRMIIDLWSSLGSGNLKNIFQKVS